MVESSISILELETFMTIIDCHVHLNKYDKISSQEKNKFTLLENRLDTLIQSMNRNNVDYSIVISSYIVDANRPSTSQIIDIVNKNEDIRSRIGIVAGFTIDNHIEEDLKQYRIWLKDRLIKGIKLYCGYEHYYPYDKRYQKVYDICMEYRVPVMIHTGDAYSSTAKLRYAHPLNVDDIAVDNPELRIVMCHLGNPWIADCQEVLYKNSNVYSDISGLVVGHFGLPSATRYVSQINDLLNYVGKPHRLLYGSDWPISNMGSYLAFVRMLELDEDSYDLMMSRNTRNIFRL
ncbi:MAG: amidohydrolase family protein [Nitrososphaeraceae archaeon]